MQNNSQKHKSSFGKVFLKSLAWTLLGIILAAIGFFGAELLFG